MNLVMKRCKILLCLLLSLSLVLSNFSVLAANDQSTAKKLFMWEVTPKDDTSGKNIIYILGSVSLPDSVSYPLNKQIDAAYNSCEKLIVESDADLLTNTDIQKYLTKYGMLPKNYTLSKQLTPAIYKKVDSFLKKKSNNKYGIESFIKYKPWVIDLLLQNMVLKETLKKSQEPMDASFIAKAKTDKKPVLEMETPEQQYKALASQSYYVQIQMLSNNIDASSTVAKKVQGMYDAWATGNTDTMKKLIFDDNKKDIYESYYKVMYYDRSIKMADCLDKYLKEGGKYFAVVSAGIITGETNIIKLLTDKGYTVKQLEQEQDNTTSK